MNLYRPAPVEAPSYKSLLPEPRTKGPIFREGIETSGVPSSGRDVRERKSQPLSHSCGS